MLASPPWLHAWKGSVAVFCCSANLNADSTELRYSDGRRAIQSTFVPT